MRATWMEQTLILTPEGDEDSAVEFFEEQRWGGCPNCPRCGDTDVVQMLAKDGTRNARFLWRCRGCKSQFTVKINTVMEDSAIPLRHWAFAFYEACKSKKGVSAKEIERQCHVTYKSALHMMHRIRWAMTNPNEQESKLGGPLRSGWPERPPRERRSGCRPTAPCAARSLLARG